MAFMGAMKGMMGPAKSMGGAMGFGGGGAGPSQNQRPTGGMGQMAQKAMNPMQQMRGLGPSGPPQQKFSGMRGPSQQRSMPQMPMQQAGQMQQPMQQPMGQMIGPPDMGSQDPSQQMRGPSGIKFGDYVQPGGGPDMPGRGMGPRMPRSVETPGFNDFYKRGQESGQDFPGIMDAWKAQRPDPNFRSMLDQMRMAGPMPQGDPNQATDQGWGDNMRRNMGLGPSMGNRGMGGEQAGGDMGMGENPFRRFGLDR